MAARSQDIPQADPPSHGRAVVHVGLNKAGSSSIQQWLAVNDAALAAQGVHQDLLGRPAGPRLSAALGFVMLAREAAEPRWLPPPHLRALYGITDRASLRASVEDFAARADASVARGGGGTYVLSSEHIAAQLRTPASIQPLHDWLVARFRRVDYVLYLRDQVEWVASGYAQVVKMGSTERLDDFVARVGSYDYHSLARTWSGVAGPGRLHVRLLERDALAGGDLLTDFAGLIGVDLAATRPPPRVNEAISRRQLAVARWGNRMAEASGLAHAPRLWRRALPLTAVLGGPKLRLSPEQAARVARVNESTNERLRQWLFPSRPVLFPTAARVLSSRNGAAPPPPSSPKGLICPSS